MGSWEIIIPEETTNLCDNPQMATLWTAYGTPTTRELSSSNMTHGPYSLHLIGDSSADGAYNLIGSLTNGETYAISVDITIISGNPRVQVAKNSSPFTIYYNSGAISSSGRLEATFTMSATDTVNLLLLVDVGEAYFDSVQLEHKAYNTTYCDGDQPGCKWNGIAHASTSTRNQFEATGGRVRDLSNDIGFVVSEQDGTGMPPVANLSSPLALQPGNLFDGQTIQGRQFSLIGSIIGTGNDATAILNFHSQKQALVKALNPNVTTIDDRGDPRTFRYTGSAVDKEIKAVYDGGLEKGLPIGMTQVDYTLRLKADDPLFYQVGESAAALDVNDSATFRTVAGKIDGVWDVLGPPDSSGTYSDIFAIVPVNAELIYFVGIFSNFDNIAAADYIVAYDSINDSWSAVGTPNTGAASITNIQDAAVDASGNLYVVGNFLNLGDVAAADYIAMWNGSSWAAVGTPNTGTASIGDIQAIAIAPNDNVYVGGNFTNLGNVAAADYIAVWNGSSWAAVGDPNSGGASISAVSTIEISSSGTPYVGGNFTNLEGDADADYIAKFDGTNWVTMPGGGANNLVRDIAITDDGRIIAVGNFTTIGGVSINRVAINNGAVWSQLGTGFDAYATNIAISSNNLIAVGGFFTTAGGVDIQRIAFWNGSVWTGSDFMLSTSVTSVFLAYQGDNLFAGWDTEEAVSYAGNSTIAYSGTYQAYPYIKIKRDGGTSAKLINITNATTKAELFFDFDFQDGEEIVIDTQPGNQSIVSSSRGNIYNEIFPNSDFGDFFLIPGNSSGSQNNIITAFVDTDGTPTMTANIIWKDAFISED